MSNQDMEEIIVKFLYNSASAYELEVLGMWLEQSGNEEKFKEFIAINYTICDYMTAFGKDRIKENLLNKIKKDKSAVIRLKILKGLKYAAVAVLVLALGYFIQDRIFNHGIKEELVPHEDDITLYLEDGRFQIISKNRKTAIYNVAGDKVGEQKGEQLEYGKGVSKKELVYHTLSVPYGKRFELLLSDGTKAYLNSGSSLKYPVSFSTVEERNVFLTGEAYFDVVKDFDKPFVVNTDEVNIRVLGTRFNVSSYPEDNSINTVLVEGSVGLFMKGEVFDGKKSSVLEPGYKASWNKGVNLMEFEEVDTDEYMAWMNGKIVFNHMAFKDILKKLERHYNVSIINTNRAVDEEVFTASFDTETIEQVLQSFSRNYQINFRIENNQIIIN